MNSKMLMLALFVVAAAAYTNPTRATLNANDINAMRYAITLENLEATFYNQMQAKFTAANFEAAGLGAATYNAFSLIQAHENAHVQFINQTMAALGFTAPSPCTYNFASVTTVQQYITTAALFEAVGVSAYAGAINTVFNTTVVQALATIATIEARHSSYLNGLNNSMPIFPADQTRDTASTPQTVGAAIAPYLTCSAYNVTETFPMLYTVVPITGTTDPSDFTLSNNDVNALNYALFLENLEAAFYNYGQGQFDANAFALAGYNASVRVNLGLIQAHEVAHAAFLTSALGSAAVPPCTYNFAAVANNVTAYIAAAALLEATGVSAYDGAVNTIYNSAYKQIAATIATVEARHSSYLNALNSNQAVPQASFDTATLPVNIITAVKGLNVITSCPNNIQNTLPLPVVYQLSAASNTTTSTGTATTRTSTTSAAPAVSVAAALVISSALLALF